MGAGAHASLTACPPRASAGPLQSAGGGSPHCGHRDLQPGLSWPRGPGSACLVSPGGQGRGWVGAPQSPGYSPHSAPRTTLEGLGSSRWTIFCCSLDPASAQSLDVSPSRPLCLDPGPPHSSWKSTEGKRAWATCRAWRKNNYSSPGSGPVHYLLLGVETEAGRCNHLLRSHAGVY